MIFYFQTLEQKIIFGLKNVFYVAVKTWKFLKIALFQKHVMKVELKYVITIISMINGQTLMHRL